MSGWSYAGSSVHIDGRPLVCAPTLHVSSAASKYKLISACRTQRGCSQGTLWRLAAEAVLEVSEVRGGLGVRELRFHMIEGDFKVRRHRNGPCQKAAVWACQAART